MTTTESRPIAVTKYFKPTLKKPSYVGNIIAIVCGGVAFIAGLSDSSPTFLAVIGCIAFGWGFIAIFSKSSGYKEAYHEAEPKPSDKQMDEWLEQDKKGIVSDATTKLGLVPEKVLNLNDPLVVIGPKNSAKFKMGQDGIIRFSAYEIMVIYLTDYHLGAYSCRWDFVNGKSISEQTQEYHYTDVVSVSTLCSSASFEVVTVDGVNRPIQSHQEFSLSVASGESIKIAVAFPQVEMIFQKGELLPTGADKAVMALRTMLREKKGGV
ncbi:hypothetical protein QUF90_20670 [Desulfococcaceae bacterium HSG9]|nr:hypothetical protein [Desulfococcaceae bacterium HSG9]